MAVEAPDRSERAHETNLGVLLEHNPHLKIGRDEYNINVTSNEGEELSPDEVLDVFADFPGSSQPAHLYYHLPLCNYICHFCNYVKRLVPRGKEEDALRLWQDLLIDESQRYLDRAPWIGEASIGSFYIGGGTAALMLNHRHTIENLVSHVRSNYALAQDVEFNIEGNPDNFERRHVELAVELGFNRFSVGVQSLHDKVNEFTKRRHSARQSLEAIANLKSTGHPFNVDMMFGLPYQTAENVRRDMQTLVDLEVPTITIYRLRNVDREEMGIGNRAVWNLPAVRERLIEQGMFPDIESTYAMRQEAVEVLLDAGYYPSPCGWWSRPGTYTDGNIPRTSKDKWEHYSTMLAYGPGAYGWLTGNEESFVQTHNITSIPDYVEFMQSSKGLPLASGRRLQGHKAIGTALGFNYKSAQPINFDRYQRQFGADLMSVEPFASSFQDLLKRGLMELTEDGEGIRPTLDGEALHEEIISHYFHERIGLSDAPVCRR